MPRRVDALMFYARERLRVCACDERAAQQSCLMRRLCACAAARCARASAFIDAARAQRAPRCEAAALFYAGVYARIIVRLPHFPPRLLTAMSFFIRHTE